jgi:hypothetical protein
VFQFKDSVGGGGSASDTSKVVIAKVHNATGTTLQRGEVVYLFGANGDVASVKRANNKQDSTSSKTFGIVRRNIAAGDTGYITTQGQIEKLNLGAFTAGDVVYLDSIDGQFTKVVPVAPYHSVFIGIVERANNGNGKVNNQILVYSDTQKVWKNRSVYSVVDTTSLSNRINTKLNATDTASLSNRINAKLSATDTISLSNRINAKFSTTDTSLLQQKSLPANSIPGNETYQTANAQSIYFKDTSGTYGGTITWTGTTAPSGATNHTYRWTRIGKLVTLTISVVYATNGTGLTSAVFTLPSDAPNPVQPSGLTSASNGLYASTFIAQQTATGAPLGNAPRALLRNNAANNGFEIIASFTSSTIIQGFINVQYTAQ